MREIKFRGKAIMSIKELELMGIEHDSGWVYGNLIKNGNRPMITADILEEIEESIYPEWWAVVEPQSIGQYTGLKDENGREIYEGDIVRHATWGDVYEVIFEDGGFYVLSSYDFQTINEYPLEVIGNIYENPELLEGEGCPTCNGSGGVDMFEDSIGEIVTIPCPDCGGSGESDD